MQWAIEISDLWKNHSFEKPRASSTRWYTTGFKRDHFYSHRMSFSSKSSKKGPSCRMGRKVELKISGHDVVNYGIGSSISCCEHLFKANLIAMSSADPPTNGQNASKAEPRWLTKNLRNTAKILSCMKPSLLPNVWSIVLRHLEQNKRQLDVRRQVDELLPWNKFSDCGSGEKSL